MGVPIEPQPIKSFCRHCGDVIWYYVGDGWRSARTGGCFCGFRRHEPVKDRTAA